MNKIRKSVTAIVSALAAAVLALAVWAGFSPPVSVTAHADAYSYEVRKFDVVMDISADRTIRVTEKITAYFSGYDSHGIIRDFTLDNGVKYRDIKAECDDPDFRYYSKNDDMSFLSVYLRGDSVITGQTRTYTLTYTMIVPALAEEGYLPLDVVGYGWQATLQDVSVTVNLPAVPERYKVYSGSYGATTNGCNVQTEELSPQSFLLTTRRLGYNNGITFDLVFPEGTLTTAFDFSVLYAFLAGAALIAAAALVKLFACRQPLMTITVNLTAPDEMDPLQMGKLIDGSVDAEDIGAVVFYLADQGYLTIDMRDESDPVLVRTEKRDTSALPPHLALMYDGLFEYGDAVRVSSLKNKFYRTVDAVKVAIPDIWGGFVDRKKQSISAVLALLSAVVMGLFAFLYAKIAFAGYNYFIAFIFSVAPVAVGYCVAAYAMMRTYRLSKLKKALCAVGSFGLCAAVAAGIAWGFPCAAYGILMSVVVALASCGAGWISGCCRCRSKKYSELLGHILGFRNFILYTEKDKIAVMLEENPELYYHILPYAQVLGVTDEWTDKFDGLDVGSPEYVACGANIAFNAVLWHSFYRSLNSSMSSAMVSRPSSSGGGRMSGGFGGGFGGGGFGGGGGRGC